MCFIEKDSPIISEPIKEVGIDLGIKSFLTRDDGVKVDNPKFLSGKSEHMVKLQQALARAKKGSNNHIKLKKKIADLHEKISNKRNNFLHNESAKLVNEFDRIYMEDLNVSGMTRSSKGTKETPGKKVKQKSGLNRNLLDVGLGEFKAMIEYKTKFNGKEVVKVNRFFASSKICNKCGVKNTDLKLSDRVWVCNTCGSELDRDENAAKNIKAEGRRSLTLKE
jgi:putative transposase